MKCSSSFLVLIVVSVVEQVVGLDFRECGSTWLVLGINVSDL